MVRHKYMFGLEVEPLFTWSPLFKETQSNSLSLKGRSFNQTGSHNTEETQFITRLLAHTKVYILFFNVHIQH